MPFPGDNHLEVVEKKNLGDFAAGQLAQRRTVPAALDAILARMLARQPRDRYQTASELIVDLERSRLAATLPTFADPELAMKDPWVQACLASSAEPTRLDPERPPDPAPEEQDDVWLVRFRNRAGRVCKTRATTDQIVARLRDGRVARRIVVRRPEQARFHPPAHFAEFKELCKARPKVRRPAAVKPEVAAVAAVFPRRRLVLLGTALAAALVAAGAALWMVLGSLH